MSTGTVVTKRPGHPAEVKTIELGYLFLQAEVGGYIELVGFADIGKGIDLFCNEEGKLNGLEPNLDLRPLDVLVGPVVALAHTRSGDSKGLTPEQTIRALEWLNARAI